MELHEIKYFLALVIMVAAGMGICFLPEYSATMPGVTIRPVIAPAIAREVSLVTVASRDVSPALAACVGAVQHYRWPEQPSQG